MDLNNVSTLIKKINRLYDIINSIGEASDTEKDLLKAYVLDLYEAVTMEPEDQSEDLEIEEMLKKLKKQKKAEKKLKKQLNKAVEQLEDMSVSEQAEEAQEEAQAAQEVEESPQASHEEPAQEESAPLEPELVELFNIEPNGVSDLSDKLSLKPISDLTKAMGINERIFTINELFDGNREEFENMMAALNGLNNFDEAKDVLIRSVAGKYRWHSDSRFKKARNFIKLIQRRYN